MSEIQSNNTEKSQIGLTYKLVGGILLSVSAAFGALTIHEHKEVIHAEGVISATGGNSESQQYHDYHEGERNRLGRMALSNFALGSCFIAIGALRRREEGAEEGQAEAPAPQPDAPETQA